MSFELIVIILVFSHLLLYVYRLSKRENMYVDYWVLTLIISNIIWYFIIYPFAGNSNNSIYVGDSLSAIQGSLLEAFVVMLIGYISMWIGKYLCDYKIREISLRKIDVIAYKVFFEERYSKYFLSFFYPILFYVVFIGVLHLGSDMRVVMGVNGGTRIIMNIAMTIFPIVMTRLVLLYFQSRQKRYLYGTIFLFFASLTLSSRALSFNVFIFPILIVVISKGRSINLKKIGIISLGIIFSILGLGFFRNGRELSFDSLFFDLLYGNTFSDIRDFAWILSGWDHDLLLGKTYLSGLMSFIPSSISSFREEWSYGQISLRLAGLIVDDGGFHGGLRGTIFCEPFINFGYVGLILFSIIYGFYVEKANLQVKHFVKSKNYLLAYACVFKISFVGLLMISSASFRIYCVLLPVWLVYKFFHSKKL